MVLFAVLGFSPFELAFGDLVRRPLKMIKKQCVDDCPTPSNFIEYGGENTLEDISSKIGEGALGK